MKLSLIFYGFAPTGQSHVMTFLYHNATETKSFSNSFADDIFEVHFLEWKLLNLK